MYTKTIVVNTDWLRDIDGMTVAGAIEYLQKLNPDHILSYSLEGGDTHGVDVSSELTYDVPMANKEILAQLESKYARQIAEREQGKQYYIDRGQLDRLPAIDKLITDIVQRRDEAREKYKD